MIRQSFTTGWVVSPKSGFFEGFSGGAPEPRPVSLPHDAVRDLPRSADSDQGSHTGYSPGGVFTYAKTFEVPEAWRDQSVTLEFEGVYRDAMVYVNGEFAGQRANGYAAFAVRLDAYLRYGQANTVTVDARAHHDSRWYSGAGIYRPVHLLVADPVHVALDGVRVTTPDIDGDRAVVAVATTVENGTRHTRTVRVRTDVVDGSGVVVVSGSAPVTLLPNSSAVSRERLVVPSPDLWGPDSPSLYEVRTTVLDGEVVLDEERTRFGIRRLQLDPVHGLRVNGEHVDLRGACIHHDNGPLGAVTIDRADERRIEVLKAAGFNAVRSAHNLVSRAVLDACDRHGMLVMDELTDVWTEAKTHFDYSLAFPEWWERDVEAMVAKDVNHPSVVMYSIGNEVFEVGTGIGSTWGRRLAEKVRELDDTRFVTNGINGFVATIETIRAQMGAAGRSEQPQDVNSMMAQMMDFMSMIAASDMVSQATEESAAVLDVVGFNYADSRYAQEAVRFPNRVIVGSETYPGNIDALWQLVTAHPHVLGDFTWTGWDYLGEAGIGRVEHVAEGATPAAPSSTGAFPHLTAGTGDIDITGHRRPVSYYRETVFGLRSAPYIAVHRPQFHGQAAVSTPWAWTDSVSSWTWDVPVGSPVTVDVYSDADEVELLLDGRSVGTTKVGETKAFLARFETTYSPGELTAVSLVSGEEQARTVLRTATGPLGLRVASDRDEIRADDTDLAYVAIEVCDAQGTVPTDADRLVTVTVEGPGVLAGLGSGRPDTEEPFGAATCTTYDGRALAIVRPTGEGVIRVSVAGAGAEPVTVEVRAERPAVPEASTRQPAAAD